ncbi:2-hydroxychromene-2-carboxylate isomerase [Denitratisoma oestradiolicum]|uniref:2-hydroxychromene-2-carboxylate isomerase n=1 Tax=Denitratisoma oestradiolicum TaxID=311182 RepID=A0A6S6XRG3_9PROT|nr:2-hydroxychromene-2-carboxylate isomerase [Denitratisoma oestradiolicum]TWO80927.1 2-hydroxychromene-2-carboxylate isomerase [Denitratisoma oestradiolicum]CAB1367305.1 2-hydroxychromene-2-carboxylate isomerase [Denitratisoma oestradiolicum]
MKTPVEFFFDFSSPYGYLASELIDDLAAAHGRQVAWHPILLGAVFKTTGSQPLVHQPLKGGYAARDFPRSARFHGLPFTMPTPFPVATQAAARLYYWFHDQDSAAARVLAHALYRAYFVEGRNIGDAAMVLTIGEAQGLERARMEAALADPTVKERLHAETGEAVAQGVFGSPYFIVDGEPFFGVDRLPQLEKWLRTGGF